MSAKKLKKLMLKITDDKMKELLKVKEVVFLEHDHLTIALTTANYDDIVSHLGDMAKTTVWEVW